MVSICMATYNGEQYLYNTLLSIQNQTYTDFEVIIVDDHSTDDTLYVALSFAKRDSRFKVFANLTDKSNPYVDSHNKSYEYASGDLLFRFDQDDIMIPTYISTYINYMDMNLECDGVSTYPIFYTMNDGKQEIIEFISNERMNRDSFNFNRECLLTYKDANDSWFNQTSCLRKSFYNRFKPKFKYPMMGDIIFWWNVLSYGANLKTIPIQLIYQNHRKSSGFYTKLYNTYNDMNKLQSDVALYKQTAFELAYKKNPKQEYLDCINVFKNTYDYYSNLK